MTTRIADDVKNRALRLKKSTIKFPLKELSPNDRKALVKLIKAADLMSEIFLRQVSPLNPKTREALQSARNKLSHEALPIFSARLPDLLESKFGDGRREGSADLSG